MIKVLGIKIIDRIKEAGLTQGILSRHANVITTRLGFHEVTDRSEEHTSELQSRQYLVCRLLLEKLRDAPATKRDIGRPHAPPHATTSRRQLARRISVVRRAIRQLASEHQRHDCFFFLMKQGPHRLPPLPPVPPPPHL